MKLIEADVITSGLITSLAELHPREDAGGFKSRIRPPYPKCVVKGAVSESPYKKVGPASV